MRHFLLSLWEILEVIIIAAATVFLIRSFLVQPFLVSGASMEPNFHDNDYLLIDEITYRFRTPERGEVVVFKSPTAGNTYFIKRLVGLPGERISVKNGEVRVYPKADNNFFVLKEGYLEQDIKTFGDFDVKLKEGQYFVLGDNRNFSFDSRSWGSLEENKMVGLVRFRLWPLNKVMAFEAPAY
ncbi:MAG: signal peptidase I [Candidatus Brennerbacteria bacterium]|nr:signal peptidase I [Candidatus Brennerbacteria bacterium]